MKSTVEQLSPTRVRISVEVPFTELEPDFAKAYKALAKQVRLPGFRPGKAPAKLLEARLGRGAVLERVVNEALPSRYSEAVTSSEVQPMGRPDIEITKLEDGEELAFTAEVDVRPKLTLPELDTLAVTVDPIEAGDDETDARLEALRARFGTLTGVERPAAEGDVVSIDLSATIDGAEVPDAATEGLAYDVGSGQLVEGLDEAIVGLSAGESKVFTSKLVAGPQAGQEAQVTVTVAAVKERELPELDDDFAQLASEFDTVAELRANLADQVRQLKRIQQAEKIRQQTLEALLEQVEIPLPAAVVQAQVDSVVHNALHNLDHSEAKFAQVLAERGSSREEFDTETRASAEKAIKTQLLLDALADDLDVQVGQEDISRHLMMMSRQYRVEPQQLLTYLSQNNQLPNVFADVRRGLAIAAAVKAATVTDTDGTVIDTAEFFRKEADDAAAEDDDQAGAEAAEALAAAVAAAEEADQAGAEVEAAAAMAAAEAQADQADEADEADTE